MKQIPLLIAAIIALIAIGQCSRQSRKADISADNIRALYVKAGRQ